jgi:hypothetical protein
MYSLPLKEDIVVCMGMGVKMHALTWVVDLGDYSASSPCSFIPGERASGFMRKGCWVFPEAGLNPDDEDRNPCPYRQSISRLFA